jgi:hypothetical protein
MPLTDGVTEEMIEAGLLAWSESPMDHEETVEAIYLAMEAARPVDGDMVELLKQLDRIAGEMADNGFAEWRTVLKARDALASLLQRAEEAEREIARLRDRMSDMMPIAGGNPMKHAGKNYSARSKP